MKNCILIPALLFLHSVFAQAPVIVTNQNLNIAGVLAVGLWQNNNSNKP